MLAQHSPLDFPSWTARAAAHARLVAPYADAFVRRRSLGHKDPVHDFLFTYYSFTPLKLKQWVPSCEQQLSFPEAARDAYPWLTTPWFHIDSDHLSLAMARLGAAARRHAAFIAELCANVARQPPRYGCYGLHEWAMVYRMPHEQIRHSGLRLRLDAPQLERFVASQSLCCTHYDAYRFFTAAARPLNRFNPLFDTRLHMEQGGCIHANMDLYKWATKLWPWIGSDFIARCFMLARAARELDMRASPYDLQAHGYGPIPIETEEGRRQYQSAQQALSAKAAPLRAELMSFCQRLLGAARADVHVSTHHHTDNLSP